MDSEQILSLTSEVKGQLWLIEKVRHAYGKDIELTQLQVNVVVAQKLYDLIAQDIDVFLSQIAPLKD